jgi:formylglycine-generating enzyme required for sulfatase activity
MVLVEGEHCSSVVQNCAVWVEDPIKNPYARCRVFEEPTICKGEGVPLHFCIDRLEAAGDDGLPLADKSWTEAKSLCQAQGKRLCQETEWLFACEGEEARPYPYGFVRNPDLCNFERTEGLVTNKGKLADHRRPVTANPYCVSPFGVQNMVGNIDEWVVLDTPHYSAKNNGRKMQSGLKGGWWGPLRNRCRPTTVDHDELFHELQTGFRCCKDAP